MNRVVRSRAVKVACHVSRVNVVYWAEVPSPLDAADPGWDARGIPISIKGSIVPNVPRITEDVS
jgi:hypothetical protein